MSTRWEADGRKRAILALALLLTAAAVALTVVSLQDNRGHEIAYEGPEPPVGESLSDSLTPVAPPSADPSPEGASGDGASDETPDAVRCVLEGSGGMLCPRNFAIEGDAVGLYPGGTVQLPLRIENPNEEDLRITSITVSVTGTSASACDASNLLAADYAGPGFVVRGDDSGSFSLPLTMSREAPDACQGVTFILSYAGEAEPA